MMWSTVTPRCCPRFLAANPVVSPISEGWIAVDVRDDELDPGLWEVVVRKGECARNAPCELSRRSLTTIASKNPGEMIPAHSDHSSKGSKAQRAFG